MTEFTLPSRAVVKRLAPHLSNWNRISDVLAGVDVDATVLKQLLAIELHGKRRRPIIRKLLGRLHTVERNTRLAAIERCLNAS